MADLKLLEEQARLLRQLQKEARERGERREPKPSTEPPRRRMFHTKERERTFDEWCTAANKARKPYPWMDVRLGSLKHADDDQAREAYSRELTEGKRPR